MHMGAGVGLKGKQIGKVYTFWKHRMLELRDFGGLEFPKECGTFRILLGANISREP